MADTGKKKKETWYDGRSDVYRVDPKEIVVVDGYNPRKTFDQEKLDALMQSIISVGVQEPLRVYRGKNKVMELVNGERRLRATLNAIDQGHPIESVPIRLVDRNANEATILAEGMIGNTGEPLLPVEEAHGFQRLINYGWDVKKIANTIGRSVPYVYKRLELCGAGPELEKAINDKKITLTEAHKIIHESDGKIDVQEKQIQEVKEEKEEKKFQKEAIKENIYSEKVMKYISFQKEIKTIHAKLQRAFKINDDKMDYMTIQDLCFDLVDKLEEVASWTDKDENGN